ncbi:hypothetical protein VTO42DRAFT_315 [Malbranchea cinnamomea]
MTELPGTQVVNYMRSPAWVYYRVPPSKHLGRKVDDPNPAYTEEEKERFRDPVAHREYRKGIIARTNRAFRLVTTPPLIPPTPFTVSVLILRTMKLLSSLEPSRCPRSSTTTPSSAPNSSPSEKLAAAVSLRARVTSNPSPGPTANCRQPHHQDHRERRAHRRRQRLRMRRHRLRMLLLTSMIETPCHLIFEVLLIHLMETSHSFYYNHALLLYPLLDAAHTKKHWQKRWPQGLVDKATQKATKTVKKRCTYKYKHGSITGFDVSHCPKFPLIGLNGANLAEKWTDEPQSYLSVATAGFPNYFIYMGPNSLGGHGSLVESINWTGGCFVKWIQKIATEDIKYVVPKKSAEEAFVRYGNEIHKTLIWTGSCKSWYKRNKVDGRVTAILLHRMISELRPEDFEIEYRSPNPFRFMGNGLTEESLQSNPQASYAASYYVLALPSFCYESNTVPPLDLSGIPPIDWLVSSSRPPDRLLKAPQHRISEGNGQRIKPSSWGLLSDQIRLLRGNTEFLRAEDEEPEFESTSAARAASDEESERENAPTVGVGPESLQSSASGSRPRRTIREPASTEIEKIPKYEIGKVTKANFSTWKDRLSTHMALQNCLEVVEYTKEKKDDPEMIKEILLHPEMSRQNRRATYYIECNVSDDDLYAIMHLKSAGEKWHWIERKYGTDTDIDQDFAILAIIQWRKDPSKSIADSLKEIESMNARLYKPARPRRWPTRGRGGHQGRQGGSQKARIADDQQQPGESISSKKIQGYDHRTYVGEDDVNRVDAPAERTITTPSIRDVEPFDMRDVADQVFKEPPNESAASIQDRVSERYNKFLREDRAFIAKGVTTLWNIELRRDDSCFA